MGGSSIRAQDPGPGTGVTHAAAVPRIPAIMSDMEWRVVHKPRVAIRGEPSTNGAIVGSKVTGAIVVAEKVEGKWIKLKGEDGWMLTDGTEVGLGMLLEAVVYDAPMRLCIMSPLVAGEMLRELDVKQDWTVLQVKSLLCKQTGLKPQSMIPARGKMGERIGEHAALKEEQTIHAAGYKDGDEFAFIYM